MSDAAGAIEAKNWANDMTETKRAADPWGRGFKVYSRDGKTVGHTTGTTGRCQLAGCTGRVVYVKWADGKITKPCSKGLVLRKASWRIGGPWQNKATA